MSDQDALDPTFDAMTARLLRRGALRRVAEEQQPVQFKERGALAFPADPPCFAGFPDPPAV